MRRPLFCIFILLGTALVMAACSSLAPTEPQPGYAPTALSDIESPSSAYPETLIHDIRERMAAQLLADNHVSQEYYAQYHEDTAWMDNLVVVQLKEGAHITVQPGVELVTAKPLQFAAIPEDEGYWLIYREHSNIEVKIHDGVVRTEPDNTSPDARYVTTGAERFDMKSDSFSSLNVDAGVTVCFDITRVSDKTGYLWPQSWTQPGGTHFFAAADQTDMVLPVDQERLLHVFDRELPENATNCAPGDAQMLRGRFLLLAGEYLTGEHIWAIDALIPQPVLLDSGTCVPFSNESQLLGSIDAGEYMLMLSYDFSCGMAPESLLGLYRLTAADESGKLRFDMNLMSYDSETLRSHNGYRFVTQ